MVTNIFPLTIRLLEIRENRRINPAFSLFLPLRSTLFCRLGEYLRIFQMPCRILDHSTLPRLRL